MAEARWVTHARTHTHTHTLHSFVRNVLNKHCAGCLIGFGSMTSLAPLTGGSLYIMFTPTCFHISVSSSGSFTFVPAKLHKFLKLKLLKLQFHKITRLKYIKILFCHCLVIQ